MKTTTKTLFASCILTSGLLTQADASIVIYEPFAQDVGNVNGATAGTGLSGNWSSDTGQVSSPSLSYGSLATSGNKVDTLNRSRLSVSTGTTLDGLLDNGDTLWFSVLIKVGEDDGNMRFGFALGTDAMTDNNNTMTNTGNGLGFGILNSPDGVYANTWTAGTPAPQQVGEVVVSGQTILVVGEMIFGATTDTINIYTPDTDLNLGLISSTNSGNYDQTLFDTVSFGIRQSDSPPYEVDEIRFGTSYADVSPIPEPSSTALLGLGGLALILRRRR